MCGSILYSVDDNKDDRDRAQKNTAVEYELKDVLVVAAERSSPANLLDRLLEIGATLPESVIISSDKQAFLVVLTSGHHGNVRLQAQIGQAIQLHLPLIALYDVQVSGSEANADQRWEQEKKSSIVQLGTSECVKQVSLYAVDVLSECFAMDLCLIIERERERERVRD